MKQYEAIAKDVDTLAMFLAAESKDGEQERCGCCAHYNKCDGREYCIKAWKDFLNSDVEV